MIATSCVAGTCFTVVEDQRTGHSRLFVFDCVRADPSVDVLHAKLGLYGFAVLWKWHIERPCGRQSSTGGGIPIPRGNSRTCGIAPGIQIPWSSYRNGEGGRAS